MKQLLHLKSRLKKLLEGVVICVMAVLVLTVIWQVVSRYLLGAPSSWSEELAKILLIWGSLLGASIAYSEKSHLGVDYFTGKLNPRLQLKVAVFVHSLVALTSAYLMVYGGAVVAWNAFIYDQTTAALNIGWGYIYLVQPITGCFFLLFAFEIIGENLANLKAEEYTDG